MAEITASAYSDLRNYIQSSWKYIELQDELGTAIVRLSPSDTRVTSIIEGNIVKVTIVVKGSDIDIVAPKTFAKSVIYNVASGGNPFSTESFTAFTIESDLDELTVIHNIEVPQVI